MYAIYDKTSNKALSVDLPSGGECKHRQRKRRADKSTDSQVSSVSARTADVITGYS